MPITFWVTTRTSSITSRNLIAKNQNDSKDDLNFPIRSLTPSRMSPTVALLESGRQVKKIRSNSVHRFFNF